jgi:hypothetical protein
MIWGSQRGGCKELYPLGYNAVDCWNPTDISQEYITSFFGVGKYTQQETGTRQTVADSGWFFARAYFFHPEDGRDKILRIIYWLAMDYIML